MTLPEIKDKYNQKIESIFELMEKIDEKPRNQRLKDILKREQAAARSLDGKRNKFSKKTP